MTKRMTACLVILGMVLSLGACGGNVQPAPENNEENYSVYTTEATETTEVTEANRSAVNYPVVVLDNEYVRITVEGKYTGENRYKNFGYNVLIENKCDKYIMVLPCTCSMDGFMLSNSESPQLEIHTIAPHMKAKTVLGFFRDTTNNDIVKTVDDLVNLDGLWQISFSEDGNGFGNHVKFRFDYILP